MFLRRIAAHLKTQNWTAVGLDLLIVVIGVFIGTQVSNWTVIIAPGGGAIIFKRAVAKLRAQDWMAISIELVIERTPGGTPASHSIPNPARKMASTYRGRRRV